MSLTKDEEKLLREYADHLPIVMVTTHEVHRMTGAELQEMGYAGKDAGQLIANKIYEYNYPVKIAANHYRRLKRAWLKDGETGISKYLHHIAKLIAEQKEKVAA